MEKIKQQIEKLITFTSTSIANVSTECEILKDRIDRGIEKMEESGLYSPKEISETKDFANQLLVTKHLEYKQSIINKARETFVF